MLLSAVLDSLVQKTLCTEDEFAATAFSQCVATLVNKAEDGDDLTASCTSVLSAIGEMATL